jgi:hypothetical protein
MIVRKIAAAALLIMMSPSVASGQPAANNIHPRTMSWLYSGSRKVLIEDPNGHWYRVALTADCPSLKTAVDVTVSDSSHGRSQLLTGGGRCNIARITQVIDNASLYSIHQ